MVRLFDTLDEAQRWATTLNGGYVEILPGVSVRCADYCPVRGFCAQWTALRAELQAAETAARAEAP